MAPPTTSLPSPGDTLLGKYRIERVIGRGGMGAVFEATHLELEDRVAIKVVLPEIAGDGELAKRFVREARTTAKIKSEHVARIYDVGQTEDGLAYQVMEYLDGTDLSAELEAHGRLPSATAVDYVVEACEALAEAHALGIVHRDLKPANLFLVRKKSRTMVKVIDFGIAKGTTDAMSMTASQTIMGSPLYMSPEQMKSTRAVDGRADVWSLGVVLYQLLAGRTPFEAETVFELMAAILSEPAPDVRARVPEVPEGLARAIQGALMVKADERTPNVESFVAAIAPFGTDVARAVASRLGGEAPPPRPSSSTLAPLPALAATAIAPTPMHSTQGTWANARRESKSKLAIPLAAAACLAIAGSVAYLAVERNTPKAAGDIAGREPSAVTPPVSASSSPASPAAPIVEAPSEAPIPHPADTPASPASASGRVPARLRPPVPPTVTRPPPLAPTTSASSTKTHAPTDLADDRHN